MNRMLFVACWEFSGEGMCGFGDVVNRISQGYWIVYSISLRKLGERKVMRSGEAVGCLLSYL